MLASVDGGTARAPRSIDELDAANRATGHAPDGQGDAGGTYSAETRTPYAPAGRTDAERGQAGLERLLADTAVPSQLQNDEFELVRHDNGRYTLVLPGVIDLSQPHWGLDPQSRSVRDVDQFALPSSADATVASNRYAQMVRAYVLEHVPPGSELMIVGHSYGADTAMDLAADPTFNNPSTGVNVTHVVAAAYFNQPQLDDVPGRTQVLVLQNQRDAAVIGEGLGYTATEARHLAGRARNTLDDLVDLGGALLRGDVARAWAEGRAVVGQPLPWPDASALLGTGVERVDGHTLVARFAGGAEGVGHHQQNYIDYLNGAGAADPSVGAFMASVARAGYAAPGTTMAVDVSVPEANHRTTYPGDGVVEQARGLWDHVAGARDWLRDGAVSLWGQVPGHDAVEGFVGDAADALPFNNAAGAALQALAGRETITLDRDATDAIQADPGFAKVENAFVAEIRQLDGYGQRPLEIPLSALNASHTVELGGQRGAGSMWEQAQHFWDLGDPEIAKTWAVAGNELTWLLRHAHVDGTAHVAADGSMTIDYRISDTLDLRPGEGRSSAYNAITTVTGAIWHDLLGAEEAQISGRFTRTLP